MENLKQRLINIIDSGATDKGAIKEAKKLEALNNSNKIKLNSDLIEIFELLALIEAGEPAGRNYENMSREELEQISLKALKMAIEQKKESFINFIDRMKYFTDEDSIYKYNVEFYDKGIYLKLDTTRSKLNVFVDLNNKVIRKPVKAKLLREIFINNQNIKVY